MPYEDLRHYLRVLEEKGKLFRIAKEVDKDWELSAVAKLVFRKIPDERRPALLFENVKGFSLPVVTGVLGASRQVYAIALETELNFEEIGVDVFKDANEKILGHHIPEELYGQVKYIPRNLLMKYCGYVFNNLNPILIKRMKLRNKILILALGTH